MFVYGSKSMLPIEVTTHAHWVITFQEDLPNKGLTEAFNLPPIVRGWCLPQGGDSQDLRGLVLQSQGQGETSKRKRVVPAENGSYRKGGNPRKLTQNWEGPYTIIVEVLLERFNWEHSKETGYQEHGALIILWDTMYDVKWWWHRSFS